jgi:hypothetical protein
MRRDRFCDFAKPARRRTSTHPWRRCITYSGEFVHGRWESVRELFMKILGSEPVSIRSHLPDIPDRLAQAIHRALAREPHARFDDVSAFRDALLPFRDP